MTKFQLNDIIDKLMNLDSDQTCPCEVSIPCPYRDKTLKGMYCNNGSCLDGMVKQVRKMVKEESEPIKSMEFSNDAFIEFAMDKFSEDEWQRLCDLLAE